ncbi:hypothetical protein SPRG_20515 [Saprolegnia parasitica CBS 223.65]|uniref:Uncharacterized protein n=1 Tax=Saprolegnia parasitica (strain CBS 223.65) TaxID=695850 RepID=A0A067CIW6_SAPPC|nr:hypothetical protein SPRG_20515 [Saprolegnia parasitica CBS 223.65]KDO26717.1 hypothetical protein SPRG_20515 [Saprolegnia parasitica CBS 223.65]|eukprot:XP_012202601.1 hypothetical protein SPRG_20515 [Saprolegnia parasitica CBS 223.65]
MKAYISEYLPWRAPPLLNSSFANYSDFNTQSLAHNRRVYTATTLPMHAAYHYDRTNDVQVLRTTIPFPYPRQLHRSQCLPKMLLGMPGLLYYTEPEMDIVCALASPGNASLADVTANGSCFYDKVATITFGTSCLWLTPSDALHGSNASNIVTLTYTYAATRFQSFLWLKLCYRILLTLFVLWRMWRCYYRHCVALEAGVRAHGHASIRCDAAAWRYEVVLGDPTALILVDLKVALAFLVDIWLSTSNVGVSILRASQNGDLDVLWINVLYLSRTVWFAYCALCATAYGLKRWHKEHLFVEVDPTLVAVAVTIYGPIFSWVSGNVAFMTRMYHWLFLVAVPEAVRGQENEMAIGCALYTLVIACLPLMYGFGAPRYRQWLHRRASVLPRDFASHHFNNLKNRLMLSCFCQHQVDAASETRGGSVYKLFEVNPAYQASPTISLRGSDVFLLCYRDDVLEVKIRLSLLAVLDGNAGPSALTVVEGPTPSRYIVNELVLPAKVTFPTPQGSVTAAISRHCEIRRPVVPSVWCM